MARRASGLCGAVALAGLLCGCPAGPTSVPGSRAMDDNRQGAFEYDRGELSAAQSWFASALEASRSIDDPRGQAIALLNLARIDEQRWQLDRALRHAEEALRLAESDPDIEGAAHSRLAVIRSQRGAHDEAIANARAAVSLAGTLDLRRKAARVLEGDRTTTLAYALVYAGGERCTEAESVLGTATQAYGKGLDSAGEAAIAHLRGLLALGRRDAPGASTWLKTALRLDRKRGRPLDVAADLEALAGAAEVAGDRDAAADWLTRALAVRESVDTPQRALATAQRLSKLGGGGAELDGRMALLRVYLGDRAATQPPGPKPCH